MRWKQKIFIKDGLKYVKTYEMVSPYRKFNQNFKRSWKLPDGRLNTVTYWKLPSGVDNLIASMEQARIDKKWEVSDAIRKSLMEIGIIVRSGKDWYPKLLENEVKAERYFQSWLYSMLISGGKPIEDAKKTIKYFEDDIKRKYDL